MLDLTSLGEVMGEPEQQKVVGRGRAFMSGSSKLSKTLERAVGLSGNVHCPR